MTKIIEAIALVLLCAFGHDCNRDVKSKLAGQSNLTITFFGHAVDQDGKPLANAQFNYRVEAFRKDWTFDTRGKPNDVSAVSVVSGPDGTFNFTISACQLKLKDCEVDGYQPLLDDDYHGDAIDNRFYELISFSRPWFKIDSDHPATYVFVKDGRLETTVLPCRGGFDSGGTTRWLLNVPGWPRRPSLPDVVFKQPATRSAAQP